MSTGARMIQMDTKMLFQHNILIARIMIWLPLNPFYTGKLQKFQFLIA